LLSNGLACAATKRGSRERKEHMINAGKYFVSLLSLSLASVGGYSRITASFSVRNDPGQVAWLATLCLGTLYSYSWDIVMDWGLLELDFDGGQRTFPRVRWATTRDRVFRSRRFYAWAMVGLYKLNAVDRELESALVSNLKPQV
jgi:hypothetical protein